MQGYGNSEKVEKDKDEEEEGGRRNMRKMKRGTK